MSANNGDRIHRDNEFTGGETRRNMDRRMSDSFGGYKTQKPGEPATRYANCVEPVFHAAEHAMRSVATGSKMEMARAKDAARSVGNGGLAASKKMCANGGQCYQNEGK